jgi:hypothetical protein
MNTENGTLSSERVAAGRTTYFIDVRQAVNNRFYLCITESRRISDTGFDQNRIFLFEENLDELRKAFEKAFSEVEQAVLNRGELPESDSSQKHARTGKLWTEEEEKLLKKGFSKKTPMEELSEKLQRSSYAITLRLEKLGLIEQSSESK